METVDRARLVRRFQRARSATIGLVQGLTPDDLIPQSMPDASPAKWHLGHTTWFFETFLLSRKKGYIPFMGGLGPVFNSYYVAAGARYERAARQTIVRPTIEEVRMYRNHVDDEMTRWMTALPDRELAETASLIELGINHEQQHQELLMTDLKHLWWLNPYAPAYRHQEGTFTKGGVKDTETVRLQGGLVTIGHAGEGFSFDNEGPAHQHFLAPFRLATRPITNEEYLYFMKDRGYDRPELWLSDGYAAAKHENWQAPLYWREHEGGYRVFTLSGWQPLVLAEPVCHVSFYEADAFARWAHARLPTEQEWEHASKGIPITGRFVEREDFHPLPIPVSDDRFDGMFGSVWEWTASAYRPYPGFAPAKGAIGEYNGKFMSGQMVLRGGSCVTPEYHIRGTYRNFFPPSARWQFSGIRLAYDA